MSRRKQSNPQCVYMDSPPLTSTQHSQSDDTQISTTSPPWNVHACESCCAEFLTLSHLQEHQMSCTKNDLVLIVSDNDAPASPASSLTFSPPHQHMKEQRDDNISTEGLLKENKESTPMSESISFEDAHKVGNDCTATAPLTSVSLSVLAEADSPPDLSIASCTSTNVFIENLESTKVAVAQFSQELCLNAEVNSDSSNNCSTVTPRLIKQLLALQQQQAQQLRLIEQIQHQLLLLASQNPNTSEIYPTCQGTLGISLINPLMTLSTHLSQQLVDAAGLAQSLPNQSASINKIKQSKLPVSSSNQDGTAILGSKDARYGVQMTDIDKSKHLIRRIDSYPSSPDNAFYSQQIDSLSPSHSFAADASQPKLVNDHSLPHRSTGNDIVAKTLPNIGEIVEDLNSLNAVAQQRKHKLPNVTSFKHKSFFDEGLFKHKCRFCAKVFGSDSALKIHLRSHTGERPYKCNVCGNRFSTRGNLKVHFQRHKEKYPNIKMNPYPVPEYLDNVPTNTGIPYGMSMLPDQSASKWLDSKPSVTNLPGLLTSSLPSLPSVIKREMQVVQIDRPPCPGISALNGIKTFENSKNNKDKERSCEELKTSLSIATSLNSSVNGSKDCTDTASTHTNSLSPLFFQDIKPKFGFGSPTDSTEASETTKLQQLVENIDKKCIDPNKCMVCHRVLSCQSALKMHYRTHTGERPFKCKICGRTFTTKGNLKTHYSIHRAMQPITVQHSCPICQEKFTNAMVLQQHIRMHMVGQLPNETLTESYQESWDESKQDENCSDETMEVINCVSDTKDAKPPMDSLLPSTLRQTINTCGSEIQETVLQEDGFLNVRLDNGSMNGNYLVLKTSGNDQISSKSRCTKSSIVCDLFQKKSSLLNNSTLLTTETHLQKSSEELTSSSLLQSNRTKLTSPLNLNAADILNHDMTMRLSSWKQETSRSYACDVCNKTCTCQSALDVHYCSHTKEQLFICTACNQGFSTKGNLKQHMLTHKQQDIQGLVLSEPANESSSMEHLISSKIRMEFNSILIKDGKEPVLEMMTSSAPPVANLKASTYPPRRTAKQHFCQTCGKTFSSSSALQIHERTHTGEKPFACSICGRAFTTKGNLKVHLGTHMGNGARRGCRIFVDGSLSFLKSSSVKVPEIHTKDKTSISEPVGIWNQYVITPFALKSNEISAIQN